MTGAEQQFANRALEIGSIGGGSSLVTLAIVWLISWWRGSWDGDKRRAPPAHFVSSVNNLNTTMLEIRDFLRDFCMQVRADHAAQYEQNRQLLEANTKELEKLTSVDTRLVMQNRGG